MPETSIMSATEIAAAIRSDEVSSVEATRACLDRIERHNPELNAFLTVCAESALEDAAGADAAVKAGEGGRALLGVPIAVKDLHETAGIRTTFGLAAHAEHVPEADCVMVERLRAAGAVIVGKTNTPALGMLGESKNRLGPDSVNPFDPGRTSGGSSGGSAAAVAAGLVPWATGSDSAGSITQPAAFCGVYGTKPSHGRVPTWPNSGDSLLFADNGPLSATVADAALMLAVTAGHDRRDPIALRETPPDFEAAAAAGTRDARSGDRPLAGLRIGWSPNLGHFAVDAEIRDIAERAARGFEDLGASVIEVTPKIEHPFEVYMPIYISDLGYVLGDDLEEIKAELYEESLPEFDEYRLGSAESLVRYRNRLLHFQSAMADVFEECALMLTPATATASFPIGNPPSRIGGRDVAAGWITFMPFQTTWNMTGQPTAALPCGLNAEGLPVALLAAARLGREDTLLRVSAAYEVARPWIPDLPRTRYATSGIG